MDFVLTDAVDLTTIELAESGPTFLHAMPNNKAFKHPRYGLIEFTPERIQRFADSVNLKYRGTEPDIDYGHKEFTDKAAGWVKSAEPRGDGLWLGVNFTEAAKEAIKTGEYRYFSPEFADKWTDPHTGREYRDVLFGGGITNRPFLRDHIAPLTMSELVDFSPKEGTELNPLEKLILGRLGLNEQSTEAEIRAALHETPNPAPPVDSPPSGPPTPPTPPTPPPANPAPNASLADDPAFKQLQQQLASTQLQLKEQSVEARLNSLNGGSYTLSAPAREAAKTLLMAMPNEQTETLDKLLTELGKAGMVKLGETGGSGDSTGQQQLDDPVAEAERRIDKMLTEELKEMNASDPANAYTEAARRVFASDPDLHLKYRNASFLSGEVK